jgi:Pyruvate/2-oxoacid:ferredoxin oxidoreductase delta subunit
VAYHCDLFAPRPSNKKEGGGPLAGIKWVLSNPAIGVTIPNMNSIAELEMNMRAMAEPYTPADEQLLFTLNEKIRPDYCRMCYQCDGKCPKGMPVPDVLRYLAYYDFAGNLHQAVINFRSLESEIQNIRCGDCSECAIQCPNGVQAKKSPDASPGVDCLEFAIEHSRCLRITSPMTRRKADSKKNRKKMLRQMKRMVRRVEEHTKRRHELLSQEWQKTQWTEKQAQQVLARIDHVLQLLPKARKQAYERIIGERIVKNADKMLSLYETDARVIVRGKADAEIEFGNTLYLAENRHATWYIFY